MTRRGQRLTTSDVVSVTRKRKTHNPPRGRAERCSTMISVRLPNDMHAQVIEVRDGFNGQHPGAGLTLSRVMVMLLERGLGTLAGDPM